jgi:hypothetical protein
MEFPEFTSVLKKSIVARSAVQKRFETSPKHYEYGIFSLYSGGREQLEGVFQHAVTFQALG